MMFPAVYEIIDEDTGDVFEKMFCSNPEDAIKIGHKLTSYQTWGLLRLKKHKKFINRLKGYGKYTEMNGRHIPIIEYEFSIEKFMANENKTKKSRKKK